MILNLQSNSYVKLVSPQSCISHIISPGEIQ